MSRTTILGKVRAACDADAQDARRHLVAARLGDEAHHAVPARATRPAPELRKMFTSFLAAQQADVLTAAAAPQVPGTIATYLRAHDVPLNLRCGSDPYLAALPWREIPDLARDIGQARAEDTAGLSRAVAGVAETGTLVLASGPSNPVTLAFVPDTHLIVIETRNIVGSYEEACARISAEHGGALPRTLNFISGPSRTGDIGGTLVLGAHGPRRLAVILVESEG